MGKETAITKAASELGVHLIPFPCQELRAGSDPKTAISLRMAFNEAKEFAPAILVLKDVESLIDKGPAGNIDPFLYSLRNFCRLLLFYHFV